MFGENLSGADNQQERLVLEGWIVGFVDGEGCFSCPIQQNRRMGRGWQVQPKFAVVQSERSVEVLELIQSFFACGKIYRNRRHDNHREDLMSYQVSRWDDLRDVIVPFFDANPLRTAKREDYASQLSSTSRAEDMVLPPRRRGDSKSEIPCRVSSDLHEWRNDLGAVSTRDSAKLHWL